MLIEVIVKDSINLRSAFEFRIIHEKECFTGLFIMGFGPEQ